MGLREGRGEPLLAGVWADKLQSLPLTNSTAMAVSALRKPKHSKERGSPRRRWQAATTTTSQSRLL